MMFKSKFQFVLITFITFGFLITPPVHSGVIGTVSLEITGGCFSFGVGGATGCGNLNTDHKAFATGNFVFTNTLSAAFNPSTQDASFDALASLQATNGTTNFSDSHSKSFPSFDTLISDPRWGMASGLVFAFGSSPDSGSLPLSFGIDLSWRINKIDPTSTPTNIFGTFSIFSNDNLNDLSQVLFGQDLPLSEVMFTSSASLTAFTTAIPEPALLTLIGIGLLGIYVLPHRRRVLLKLKS